MRTKFWILLSVFLLCGSLALAQTAPQPSTPPPTGNKSSGVSGTSTTGSGTSTTGNKSLGVSGTSTTGSSSGAGSSTTGSSSGTATKKPEAGSLEEMLDKALRNNPDIRAAEAKVRAAEAKVQDAEAECNRVRQQVIAKIVGLRNDIELAQKMLRHAQEIAANEASALPATTRTAVLMAAAKVDTQKAELAKLEADLKAVLGSYAQIKSGAISGSSQGFSSSYDFGTRFTVPMLTGSSITTLPGQMPTLITGTLSTPSGIVTFVDSGTVQTPMAERIKAALEKSVQLNNFNEASVQDVTKVLMEKAGSDVTFRVMGTFDNATLSLSKAELSLSAWLQMIEDSVPNLRFVVRDYGILATTKDRVPEGAISVQDFQTQQEKKWKAKELTPKTIPDDKPPTPKP